MAAGAARAPHPARSRAWPPTCTGSEVRAAAAPPPAPRRFPRAAGAQLGARRGRPGAGRAGAGAAREGPRARGLPGEGGRPACRGVTRGEGLRGPELGRWVSRGGGRSGMAEVRGSSRVGPHGARGCGETRRARCQAVGARRLGRPRHSGTAGWLSGAGAEQPRGQAPGWGPACTGCSDGGHARLSGWGARRSC